MKPIAIVPLASLRAEVAAATAATTAAQARESGTAER
jgi:biotin synthase